MRLQLKQSPSILLIVCVLVPGRALAQQLPAQTPASAQITADTGTLEEGQRAGKIAARERVVAGRAVLGFVGGVPVGFMGVLAAHAPVGAVGVGTGLVIIGAAARLGNTRLPQNEFLIGRGEVYRRAYSESYAKKLTERRSKAVLLGGLAGAATGAGLLVMFISQVDY